MADARLQGCLRPRRPMCAFCCGIPEAKAKDGQRVCHGILECKFMKKAGFEVKALPKAVW